MLSQLRKEFKKDFTITRSWDKICYIYGALTLPVISMMVWLQIVKASADPVYKTLKYFGFFTI